MNSSRARLDPLDTQRSFETPEGVELSLTMAGPFVRAEAWIVDTLIRTVLFFIVSIIVAPFGRLGAGFGMIMFFVLSYLYPILCEQLMQGTTPGKRVLGLRVVHDNGTPVGWSASIVRNLLRPADFAPLFYGSGLVSMLLSPDFKRLGDLAAGTVVVHAGSQDRFPLTRSIGPGLLPPLVPTLPSPGSLASTDVVPPAAPAARLVLAEQRAILDYALRIPLLSEARARELAAIARPVVFANGQDATHDNGEDLVAPLAAVANWIAGRR